MTKEFEDQIAIVTGAASGIGLEIAHAFHDAGARVVLGDVNRDGLDAIRESFADPDRIACVPVDVRDEQMVNNLVALTEQTFGPPTIMIANAGIVPNVSVLTMDADVWDTTMDVNLKGVFLCSQAAARSMANHGIPGRIVTISSIAQGVGRLGAAAYCASKAGVVMFTKVLAMELAPLGITANSVAPGVIDIPRRNAPSRSTSAFGDALDAAIPRGRRGQPGDVAASVLYLCSPEAAYITGALIPVDGGMSTGWTHMPYSAPQA